MANFPEFSVHWPYPPKEAVLIPLVLPYASLEEALLHPKESLDHINAILEKKSQYHRADRKTIKIFRDALVDLAFSKLQTQIDDKSTLHLLDEAIKILKKTQASQSIKDLARDRIVCEAYHLDKHPRIVQHLDSSDMLHLLESPYWKAFGPEHFRNFIRCWEQTPTPKEPDVVATLKDVEFAPPPFQAPDQLIKKLETSLYEEAYQQLVKEDPSLDFSLGTMTLEIFIEELSAKIFLSTKNFEFYSPLYLVFIEYRQGFGSTTTTTTAFSG